MTRERKGKDVVGIAGSAERVRLAMSEKALLALVGILAAGGTGKLAKVGYDQIREEMRAIGNNVATLKTDVSAISIDVAVLKAGQKSIERRLDLKDAGSLFEDLVSQAGKRER